MPVPGSNIRLLREQMGLSVRSLAEAADIDPASLSRLENGKGGYTHDGIRRIARELNVTLEVLFAETANVEAAAVRMRKIPFLDRRDLQHLRDGETGELSPDAPFLYIDLARGSGTCFAFDCPNSANEPDIRIGDVLVFDRGKRPNRGQIVIAIDQKGELYLGRFRPLTRGTKHTDYEIIPAVLSFPIASSETTQGLKFWGTLVEMRRSF